VLEKECVCVRERKNNVHVCVEKMCGCECVQERVSVCVHAWERECVCACMKIDVYV